MEQDDVCGTTVINHSHSWDSGQTTRIHEVEAVLPAQHMWISKSTFPAYKRNIVEKCTQISFTVLFTLLYIWNPLPVSVPVNTGAIGWRRVFVTELAVLCCWFSLSVLSYSNFLYCQVQEQPPVKVGTINTLKRNGETQIYLFFN